jgi:ABC-type nickel/cobalt efflux system permease component RcnA
LSAARRALALVTLALAVIALLPPPAAMAHPLGNFTANRYAGIVVAPDIVRVGYVLDLAEIPAFQTLRSLEQDGGDPDEGVLDAYGGRTCQQIADGVTLTAGGDAAPVTVEASRLSLPEGEAGLPTLRLECELVAPVALGTDEVDIAYTDANDDGRPGWHEVTAVGDGVRLAASDVPDATISQALEAYPEERLQSPLDVQAASLTVVADADADQSGTAVAAGGPVISRGLGAIDQAFTGLIAGRALTPLFALTALLAAVVLGGMHALAPGHGKTVMAALVVGRGGSGRQALALAGTVAVTHTIGVLTLGVVLTVTQVAAPERLYPILGVASGLLFAAVGGLLLRRALQQRRSGRAHGHDHDHGHDHHHDHAGLTWKSLIAPGLAGGLLPSPSAVLVLLGGIAVGRAWFGVGLVMAYGVGLAAVLVGAGVLLVRAQRRLAGRAQRPDAARMRRLMGALPLVTASAILVLGLALAARSVIATV